MSTHFMRVSFAAFMDDSSTNTSHPRDLQTQIENDLQAAISQSQDSLELRDPEPVSAHVSTVTNVSFRSDFKGISLRLNWGQKTGIIQVQTKKEEKDVSMALQLLAQTQIVSLLVV